MPTRYAIILLLSAALLSLTTLSCKQDYYDTGTGQYSLLLADFVEAPTNADAMVSRVFTDDGDTLTLTPPYTPRWKAKADTTYRALLYYNKVENGKGAAVVSLSSVGTATILPIDSFQNGVKTDPIRVESIWLGKNRRYLNAGIFLKVGYTDNEDAIHLIAIVRDTLMVNADSTRTLHLRLYHDQGGVPEYYSQRTFFSIPMYNTGADSVSLIINTYDGIITRKFKII